MKRSSAARRLSILRKIVLLGVACSITANAWAFYPKSKEESLFGGMYPTYPDVDYGTGDEAALIRKGEYLAKIGDCIACHTDAEHGGKAFAGGLSINTPFGTFYSPNITFDKEYGIGTWTEQEFIEAMRDGKRPAGGFYFPVFPYIYFSKVSDDDLSAIYAYLKHIPSVNQKNRDLPFPFNVPGARYALFGWNLLFFYPEKEPFQHDPERSKEWNRGAYLVQGLGHCSMCHTPLNPLGAPKNKYYLTGTFIDGYWAPNITKYGLKSASLKEVADVFSENELINQAGTVQGPMAEVNHDSLQYLTASDRMAIAVYLKTVATPDPRGVSPIEYRDPEKWGKQVYVKACSTCHKQGEVGAPVIGDGHNWYLRLQEVGVHALYRHAINGYNSMPPKGACVTCSDDDVIAAVDYLLDASLSRAQWHDLKADTIKQAALDGKVIYQENCAVCHAEGKLGAPKTGDKKVWSAILQKDGLDRLMANTINGPHHPKNGGCKHCSTQEVIAALKYMVEQSTEGDYSLW